MGLREDTPVAEEVMMSVSPNPPKTRRWVIVPILLTVIVFMLIIQFGYFVWILGMYELDEAGQIGDTFGAVTAYFTAVGFVGTALIVIVELQNIKQRQKERIEAERLQRRVTTMSMVYDLENEFGSKRMRMLRHIASGFFLRAEDEAISSGTTPKKPTPEEEIAVRDTLYFLERVAHFTNEELVDDDLVLSVFGSRLLVYWKYANEYFRPLEEVSPSSLRLAELRWLCASEENGIKGWLRWMNEEERKRWIREAAPEYHETIRQRMEQQRDDDIQYWYNNEVERRKRLEREYRRNGQLSAMHFLRNFKRAPLRIFHDRS
jgi:hypothetical protein